MLPATSSMVMLFDHVCLQAFHTIAEAMSAMSNIILADKMGDTSYSIETTNYPLPNSVKNKVSALQTLKQHYRQYHKICIRNIMYVLWFNSILICSIFIFS